MKPVILFIAALLMSLCTVDPSSAQGVDGRIRPVQIGNGTASFAQEGGETVLRLAGTTGGIRSANMGGILIDNFNFGNVNFDLEGKVTFYVRGSYTNRFNGQRVTNALLELPIRKYGNGFKNVSISNLTDFVIRNPLFRDLRANNQDPVLIAGVAKLRRIRINGNRQPVISTESLNRVPEVLRGTGTRVPLQPLRLF